MKSKIFCAALLSLLFCACSENNQPTDLGGTISCDPTTKTVTKAVEEFVVTLKSTTAWSATVDHAWVTLSPNNGQGDALVTVKVNGGSVGIANVLFCNGKDTAKLVITRMAIGSLPGEFSVSASEKVHFSQGNLQYVGKWQFANHQWDFFGDNQYDNHRDLFGWGTGDAPNKVNNNPRNYTTFTDWGTNAISNGGNKANLWRTLTEPEWKYLFFKRSNAEADTLFGYGSANGVNGMILLPDNWELPAGASFTSIRQGYNNSNYFSHNTYSAAQWETMESAGAVFLPAAGNCDPSMGNYYSNGSCCYWSSTPYGVGIAFYLCVSSSGFFIVNSYLYLGNSVRLVR